MTIAETISFSDWLIAQLGQCKWVVARSSKGLREQGYDRFFSQKKFTVLKQQFERDTTQMSSDIMSLHLTEPNKELGEKRRKTPPGMAFWAGTGPAGKTCRECKFWENQGWLTSCGLLKDAHCEKYTRMMNGNVGGRIPHFTVACKYFEAEAFPPSIEKR